MAIKKSEIKGVIKGTLLAIGGWWIAFPIGDKILEFSPLQNTFILGIALIAIVLFWD